MQRAPAYISNLFHKVRARHSYASAVYQAFNTILKQLKGSPPSKAGWFALLKDIPRGSLGPLNLPADHAEPVADQE